VSWSMVGLGDSSRRDAKVSLKTGPAAKTAPSASLPPWTQKMIHFSDEKAHFGPSTGKTTDLSSIVRMKATFPSSTYRQTSLRPARWFSPELFSVSP